MKPFTFVAVVVLVAASSASPALRLGSHMEIREVEPGYQSSLPEVYGVRSCGGAGRVIAWRYEPCRKDGTCQVPGDGERRPSEVEFVPSDSADGLGLRINLVTDGTAKTVYDRPVANSAVQGGKTYIAHSFGSAREQLKGQTVIIQHILYRVEDSHVETCVEADFEVV